MNSVSASVLYSIILSNNLEHTLYSHHYIVSVHQTGSAWCINNNLLYEIQWLQPPPAVTVLISKKREGMVTGSKSAFFTTIDISIVSPIGLSIVGIRLPTKSSMPSLQRCQGFIYLFISSNTHTYNTIVDEQSVVEMIMH